MNWYQACYLEMTISSWDQHGAIVIKSQCLVTAKLFSDQTMI